MSSTALPPMISFPTAAWKDHLVPEEWEACLDAWITLAHAHLSFSASDFARYSAHDSSIPIFLTSYAAETATSHEILVSRDVLKTRTLRKESFFLLHRLLELKSPSEQLCQWEFLANISKVYGKQHGKSITDLVWNHYLSILELSLASLKSFLIKELDDGLKGDLKGAELQLRRLNHLLHASPQAAAFFMAGSDFFDSLVSCYKIMNPPLRKSIISTTYLCLLGLTEGDKPNYSALVDQLYSLKAAAEVHKLGPTNVNDSLVAELITATPLLRQIQHRIELHGSSSSRAKSVISALETYRKAGGLKRPPRLVKRNLAKGKSPAAGTQYFDGQVHVHRMSLISQIQDLFPDLGSAFIVKLLDEYNDDVEQATAHLLEGSLPAHLDGLDRTAELEISSQVADHEHMAPRSTPPHVPIRRNIFDDDEFDQLAIDTSKLHFGRRDAAKTADDILKDRSKAPNKAAILSALAAFDSDDDERDDTYDVEDVGGTVDSATPGNSFEEANANLRDGQDEALFRAYKQNPQSFARDAATRRSKARTTMREEIGMTDEALEGWALMLSRDPRQMKKLEAKFSGFPGAQRELAPTSWRANTAGSGTEDSDVDASNRGRGGFRGRGRGRGRGNVAGPASEKDTEVARQRKEANKGSRANHNRRDQRARKMARGGLAG